VYEFVFLNLLSYPPPPRLNPILQLIPSSILVFLFFSYFFPNSAGYDIGSHPHPLFSIPPILHTTQMCNAEVPMVSPFSPTFFYVRMSGPFNAVGISILSYFSPNIQLLFFFRNLSTKIF
jgi:hypothetical protein